MNILCSFIVLWFSCLISCGYSSSLVHRRVRRQFGNDDRPVWDVVDVEDRYAQSGFNFPQQTNNGGRRRQTNQFGFNDFGQQGFGGQQGFDFNRRRPSQQGFGQENFPQLQTGSRPQNQGQQPTNPPSQVSPAAMAVNQLPFTVNSPPRNFVNCMARCQTTSQYNPICGTDNMTYTNDQRLLCAQNCGASVQQRSIGACPLNFG